MVEKWHKCADQGCNGSCSAPDHQSPSQIWSLFLSFLTRKSLKLYFMNRRLSQKNMGMTLYSHVYTEKVLLCTYSQYNLIWKYENSSSGSCKIKAIQECAVENGFIAPPAENMVCNISVLQSVALLFFLLTLNMPATHWEKTQSHLDSK